MRGALLRCGSIGAWQIGEGLIEMERLADADAIFVTNSLNGVVTAIMIGGASATKNKQSAVLGDTLNDALPKFTEF